LNYKFSVPNLIQEQGDLLFVKVDPFKIIDNISWLAEENRKYPFNFNYPFRTVKNIEFNFPADKFSIRNLPELVFIAGEEISYTKEFNSKEPGIITLNESLEIKKRLIETKRYPRFREQFNQIKTKADERLILTRN
jgi:hypothetical protein